MTGRRSVPSVRRTTRVLAVSTVLLTLVCAAVAAPVAAAGDTTVRVVASDGSLAVGEETTLSVVVSSADGGIGVYDIEVTVENPRVATIVDVALGGTPTLSETSIAADGSVVGVRAALADTADAGTVQVLTVTVRGEDIGTTDVSVSVETLGDEGGNAYTVTSVSESSLGVTAATGATTDDTGSATGDPAGSGDSGSGAGPTTTEADETDDATTGSEQSAGGGDDGDTAGVGTGPSDDKATDTPAATPPTDPAPTATERPDASTDDEPGTDAADHSLQTDTAPSDRANTEAAVGTTQHGDTTEEAADAAATADASTDLSRRLGPLSWYAAPTLALVVGVGALYLRRRR